MPIPFLLHIPDLIESLGKAFNMSYGEDPLDKLFVKPYIFWGLEAYSDDVPKNMPIDEYLRKELEKTDSPYKKQMFTILLYFLLVSAIDKENNEIRAFLKMIQERIDYFTMRENEIAEEIKQSKSEMPHTKLESRLSEIVAMKNAWIGAQKDLLDVQQSLQAETAKMINIIKEKTTNIVNLYAPAHREMLSQIKNENQEFTVTLDLLKEQLAKAEKDLKTLAQSIPPNLALISQKSEEARVLREQVNGIERYIVRRNDYVVEEDRHLERSQEFINMSVEDVGRKIGIPTENLTEVRKANADSVLAEMGGVHARMRAKDLASNEERDISNKLYIVERLGKAPMPIHAPNMTDSAVKEIITVRDPQIENIRNKVKGLTKQREDLQAKVAEMEQKQKELEAKQDKEVSNLDDKQQSHANKDDAPTTRRLRMAAITGGKIVADPDTSISSATTTSVKNQNGFSRH